MNARGYQQDWTANPANLGSTFLSCLGLPPKSHLGTCACKFLKSLRQKGMKKDFKRWKEFSDTIS